MSGKRRRKTMIYGLFPTLYSTCAPCCRVDLLSICSPSYGAEQAREYPEWVASNQRFMEELVRRLRELDEGMELEVVGADSLKGFFLSVRYGLGSELAVIIDGKVFRGKGLKVNDIIEYVRSGFGKEL